MEFISIGDCPICSKIGESEHGFSKYGHDYEGPPWPAEAEKLVHAKGKNELQEFRGDLKVCPVCGTFYSYRQEYEFLANGSEDSVDLARLPLAEVEPIILPNEYADHMKQFRRDLRHESPKSRSFAARCLCADALDSCKLEVIEKLLAKKNPDIRLGVILQLRRHLYKDDRGPDLSRAAQLKPLRKMLWRVGMSAKEEEAKTEALQLLRLMEGA